MIVWSVSSRYQPCSRAPNPITLFVFGCQTPCLTSSDVWTLYEPSPEGSAALLYNALLQGAWQTLVLLVLAFLLFFCICGLLSCFCILAFNYGIFYLDNLMAFSFVFVFLQYVAESRGNCALFFLSHHLQAMRNSDRRKKNECTWLYFSVSAINWT